MESDLRAAGQPLRIQLWQRNGTAGRGAGPPHPAGTQPAPRRHPARTHPHPAGTLLHPPAPSCTRLHPPVPCLYPVCTRLHPACTLPAPSLHPTCTCWHPDGTPPAPSPHPPAPSLHPACTRLLPACTHRHPTGTLLHPTCTRLLPACTRLHPARTHPHPVCLPAPLLHTPCAHPPCTPHLRPARTPPAPCPTSRAVPPLPVPICTPSHAPTGFCAAPAGCPPTEPPRCPPALGTLSWGSGEWAPAVPAPGPPPLALVLTGAMLKGHGPLGTYGEPAEAAQLSAARGLAKSHPAGTPRAEVLLPLPHRPCFGSRTRPRQWLRPQKDVGVPPGGGSAAHGCCRAPAWGVLGCPGGSMPPGRCREQRRLRRGGGDGGTACVVVTGAGAPQGCAEHRGLLSAPRVHVGPCGCAGSRPCAGSSPRPGSCVAGQAGGGAEWGVAGSPGWGRRWRHRRRHNQAR